MNPIRLCDERTKVHYYSDGNKIDVAPDVSMSILVILLTSMATVATTCETAVVVVHDIHCKQRSQDDGEKTTRC